MNNGNTHQVSAAGENSPRTPRIYLAGKIRKNCWRHQLVKGLREHDWNLGPLPQLGFTYVGPFFVSCDHGCYHTNNSHGNTMGHQPSESELALHQKAVVQRCRSAINQADIVFCFIESLDCFGTIAEIERAHILGKCVVIAFAPGLASAEENDLWFVCTDAHSVHYDVTEAELPKLLALSILGAPWL